MMQKYKNMEEKKEGMEDNDVKHSITVFISLVGLIGIVFYVSQTEQSVGLAHKALYIITTLSMFAYLTAAFMKKTMAMGRIGLVFCTLSLITVLSHANIAWIPYHARAIAVFAVILAFIWSIKLMIYDSSSDKKSSIKIIDQTKNARAKRTGRKKRK
jgi:hypothetical protein